MKQSCRFVANAVIIGLVVIFSLAVILSLTVTSPSKYALAGNNPLKYYKDERTNLCFAYMDNPSAGVITFANVPCENIENYLKLNPSVSP